MKSKETRKLRFFETQWFNEFFFIFLIEKREGLAFERLKFASSRPEHPRQRVLFTKLVLRC